MRFLADENFPKIAISTLREAGLDVLWIAEIGPGAPDSEVLALCISTSRTLLTLDKDFGELVFHHGLPSDCGVVLFRAVSETPNQMANLARYAIQSQPSWAGYFSVVTPRKIRMRAIPPPSGE